MTVPDIRIQTCNDAPINEDGDFVLYWMTAHRRLYRNFSLKRAADYAPDLKNRFSCLKLSAAATSGPVTEFITL